MENTLENLNPDSRDDCFSPAAMEMPVKDEREHTEAQEKVEKALEAGRMGSQSQKFVAPVSEMGTIQSRLPRPKSVAEIMGVQYEGPAYLVEGVVTKGLIVLGGAPKSGKTSFATSMSLAVSTGEPFLDDLRTEASTVLFIGLEDSERGLQKRISGLAGLYTATEKFLYINRWGADGQDPVELLDLFLSENPNVGMVVIDPWILFLGADAILQSGYRVEYGQVRALKLVADRHGVSIVILHHTTKKRTEDWVSQYYGSFALPGAADVLLLLDRPRGSSTATLRVTGRDIEDMEIGLTFDPDLRTWLPYDGDVDEGVEISPEQEEVLMLLINAEAPVQLKEIARATGKATTNISNILNRLIQSGKVRRPGRGLYEALMLGQENEAEEGPEDLEMGVNEDEDENPCQISSEMAHPNQSPVFESTARLMAEEGRQQ